MSDQNDFDERDLTPESEEPASNGMTPASEPEAPAFQLPVEEASEASAPEEPEAEAVEEGEGAGGDDDGAAPLAEEATTPAEDSSRQWYVVHCYSGQENKVRHNLEQRIATMGMKDKIFDVIVPT